MRKKKTKGNLATHEFDETFIYSDSFFCWFEKLKSRNQNAFDAMPLFVAKGSKRTRFSFLFICAYNFNFDKFVNLWHSRCEKIWTHWFAADFDKLWVFDDFKLWHFFSSIFIHLFAVLVVVSFNWLNLHIFSFIYCFCLDFWFFAFIALINTMPAYFGVVIFWHGELLVKFIWIFNYLLIYKLCFIRAYQFTSFLSFTAENFLIFFLGFDPKNLRNKQNFMRKWLLYIQFIVQYRNTFKTSISVPLTWIYYA